MQKTNTCSIAPIVTILSRYMDCHREYTFHFMTYNLLLYEIFPLSSLMAMANIYCYFCRFADRGRLLSKHEVRSMQSAPRGHGVLFIGDQSGLVTVWKVKPVH